MTLALYKRVVLTRDLPEEGLRAGQGGVIVEHYPARIDVSESYELKIFAATGQTIWRGPESSSAASLRTVPQLSLFSLRLRPSSSEPTVA
ncbi:MAG: hypothetical protein DMF78_14170 [Acidobacteria bacterium]|nr:MAG: hypothetical protein DMF78_14170 [Acidobacteriota bacterium]